MMLLADDERREQEFTVGESRSRLRFGAPNCEPSQPGTFVFVSRGHNVL